MQRLQRVIGGRIGVGPCHAGQRGGPEGQPRHLIAADPAATRHHTLGVVPVVAEFPAGKMTAEKHFDPMKIARESDIR